MLKAITMMFLFLSFLVLGAAGLCIAFVGLVEVAPVLFFKGIGLLVLALISFFILRRMNAKEIRDGVV